MAKPDRDIALEIAAKFEREAYDLECMGGRGEYTDIERRLLRVRANERRACAQELKDEMNRLRRG